LQDVICIDLCENIDFLTPEMIPQRGSLLKDMDSMLAVVVKEYAANEEKTDNPSGDESLRIHFFKCESREAIVGFVKPCQYFLKKFSDRQVCKCLFVSEFGSIFLLLRCQPTELESETEEMQGKEFGTGKEIEDDFESEEMDLEVSLTDDSSKYGNSVQSQMHRKVKKRKRGRMKETAVLTFQTLMRTISVVDIITGMPMLWRFHGL